MIAFDVSLDAGGAPVRVGRMSSWSEFEAAAPELAAGVRARLDAHKHQTLATLRRDGSPRISGTESQFIGGELWIGSMIERAQGARPPARPALRAAQRLGRPVGWQGDAKVAGVVEEITDEERVREINGEAGARPVAPLPARHPRGVVVALNDAGNRIVVRWWTPEGGERRLERE